MAGLTRPLGECPLLICGPVLRRVSPLEVTVLVVTKTACVVALVVEQVGDATTRRTSTPTVTRALGAALHVAVHQMVLPADSPLRPEVLYRYDVELTVTGGGPTETLADQPGLLSGSLPLGYAAGELPTFALPPAQEHLNLLHGSCRKPHGGGTDALAMADRLIERSRTGTPAEQARRRPHQLLLTGDQIYADDVALGVLATLQEAAGVLLAHAPEETFPGTPTTTIGAPAVRPGARQDFLGKSVTSSEARCHLMFLAEFLAMYVLCWSDELWPRKNGALVVGPATLDPALVEADDDLPDEDREERAELASFLLTLRQVRRALANVPAMMMFDDHEVTDDWNLDKEWFDLVRSDARRGRIVRNGLLAYAVFQGWGNEPTAYESGVGRDVLDAVTVPAGGTAPPVIGNPAVADVALDLGTAPGTRMAWDWSIDGPGHRVIALDPRTRRDYTSMGPEEPGLLTDAEMQRQLTARRPGPDALAVVIAPAPVVGHPLVEGKIQPGMAFAFGNESADLEAWSVNKRTYQGLLRRLADFRRVVLLSGDVHYGFTNHTAYFGARAQPPARLVQLCSSASKNSEFKTHLIQRIGYLGGRAEAWLGFDEPIEIGLRDALLSQLRTPSPVDVLGSWKWSLLVRILTFQLFWEGPGVLPLDPWTGATREAVRALSERNLPGDWRYRTRFVTDRRSGGERRAAAEAGTQLDWLDDLLRAKHKSVLGEPNLGQVSLRSTNGTTHVVHRLHWMTAGAPGTARQTFTEHLVPYTVPGADERPTVAP